MLTGKEIIELGYKQGPVIKFAKKLANEYKNKKRASKELKRILENPHRGEKMSSQNAVNVAYYLLGKDKEEESDKFNHFELEKKAKYFSVYNDENIEEGAKNQMYIASKLPIAYKGSLQSDAHQGYGIPIGGVLACKNTIIPYGVGVDIGCRMALTIYELDVSHLEGQKDKLKKSLEEETAFGSQKEPKKRYEDEVLDRKEFKEIKKLKQLHKTAAEQIGSSGGGNHFVEWGIVEIEEENNKVNLPPGKYIGILTHSGSRGLGANIARHYTNIAMEKCKLPKEAQGLAWLDLDSEEGEEYWKAMNLAGDYAKACHDHIHTKLSRYMGWKPIRKIENHHNFAWKEIHDGEEYIVHRKGATPANKGELGIIPGSMTSKGYIVEGKGNENSLRSASHGAGRVLSRSKAKQSITRSQLDKMLADNGVELLGGGLDEAPIAYKDIDQVMNSQKDLVDIIGSFTPRIIRMAND